jgi:pyruvate kinase
MLSGESANGKYPVEAARTMARIAKAAETHIDFEGLLNAKKDFIYRMSLTQSVLQPAQQLPN